MLSKGLMAEASGGRRKTAPKSYDLHHVHADAPRDVRLERVLAPNLAAALNMAARLFPDTAILRIRKTPPRPRVDAYPDARFIKGVFHPVCTDEQPLGPAPAD